MTSTMHRLAMKQPRFRRQQQGVVLIIALVILVLVTLVGLSTIRTTTMEERMAGNSRDRDKAFQAAEAAVQHCLGLVDANTYAATKLTPTSAGTSPHWETAANWDTSSSNSFAVAISDTTAKLAQDPRCMVETLGSSGSYRVTGRAVGASAETVVMLQATYSKE
jgi:type IV pilus assembly protein PilX